MFCKNCGKQIKENAVYCPYCGGKQKNDEIINKQQYQENVELTKNQNQQIEANNQQKTKKKLNKKFLIGLSSLLFVK